MKRTFFQIFTYLLLALGVLALVDSIILMSFGLGLDFGIVFPGVAGIVLIFYSVYKLIFPMRPLIRKKSIRRVFTFLILIGILSFIAVESFIMSSSIPQENAEVDYVVILGAGLRGEELSLTLYERMAKGLDYLKEHSDTEVVVTGGQGFGETIPEAEAMKRFLVNNNIDANRVIKEDKSTSTMENFKFSKKVLENLDKKDKYTILIITSDFHMMRAKFLARRNGFIPYGLPSKTPVSVRVNYYLREYFAVVKSFFLDRV